MASGSVSVLIAPTRVCSLHSVTHSSSFTSANSNVDLAILLFTAEVINNFGLVKVAASFRIKESGED